MNIDELRKALTAKPGEEWVNPYAVNISYDEYSRSIRKGDSPYVKCRDCKSIVLEIHAVEHPEDYVCLMCEESYKGIGKS